MHEQPSQNDLLSIENGLNRRSDTGVRSAIDAIQNLLFDPQAAQKVFPLVLKHVVTLTQSDYGAIILIDSSHANGRHAIHKHFKYNSIDSVEESALLDLVENRLAPMRPSYFNDPIPKSYKRIFDVSTQVKSTIVLPVISRGKSLGYCIVSKKYGKFTGAMLNRLNPLLGSVICALQSSDTVKGNLLSLNQKISDNRFLSTLMATSPNAILVVDDKHAIVTCNPAAIRAFANRYDEDIYGPPSSAQECLNGRDIHDFIPDFENMFTWSNQQSPYGDSPTGLGPRIWEALQAFGLDGSEFLVNISVFRYTHGVQRFTTLQIQDITALHDSLQDYQQTSQQLSALTNLVPVGIIRVNTQWECIYANDKWFEFSGMIDEENRGIGWINALHGDDVKKTLEALRESLQTGIEYQSEIRLVTPLGKVIWVDFSTSILFDANGLVEGFLATFADITERLEHQEKLRHIAEFDSLTGLVNRNLFQDRLQQAFYGAERDDNAVSVFFMDLDGFKDVNDSLGHDIGDKLLQKVAERLLNSLRKNDTVARFGGDEFVILLADRMSDDETAADIGAVAEKLIVAISEPYAIDDHDVYITASLGIATGTQLNSSSEKILKQADAALYLAKAEGKNNFQLFNDDLDKAAKKRVNLAKQLRIALKQKNFFLEYQPQAATMDNSLVGFEALIRMQDEKGNVVYPDDFIPVLEESGLIIQVGEWVIEEGCRQLRHWMNLGVFPKEGFLSINVSPKQLLNESFCSLIVNACSRFDIDPSRLIIEITETVLIDRPNKVQRAINSLKDIGVQLALDDFGTGYSSLTYLQTYHFDQLKIDKTFVADLCTDDNDAKITNAIIVLAQSLGLKITAEGVNNLETLRLLQEYGADFYQGFYLGKPCRGDILTDSLLNDKNVTASDNVININHAN